MEYKSAIKCTGFIIFSLWSSISWTTGLEVRLWPVNEKGNEGFVELFYNGSWGFLGNPAARFDDVTASFLCQKLGLSQFGYSSGWTSIDNYMGYSWLHELVCSGNETDIDQCFKPYDWERYNYGNKTDWAYRHGTRLYCTDSRLAEGEYQNSGRVETVIQGQVYAICHDTFNMNAANVFCNSLGYNGATDVYKGDPGQTAMFPGTLSCNGCEDSLSNCTSTTAATSYCTNAAHVTCNAVRLARMSRYTDEGPVEIYYNGSWGLIGNPGFRFDDTTARYLCKRFGLGDVGFSTSAHSLSTYGRKGWLNYLNCAGTEIDVMQCGRSRFSATPTLMKTYRSGTWLYCFDFRVDDIRLVGGADKSEGSVQLQINGRWGYICTYAMRNLYMEHAGKVLCKQMGYRTIQTVLFENNRGHSDDLVWMSEVACRGDETTIDSCFLTKGPIYPCFNAPVFLRIKCTDQDPNEAGTIVG